MLDRKMIACRIAQAINLTLKVLLHTSALVYFNSITANFTFKIGGSSVGIGLDHLNE